MSETNEVTPITSKNWFQIWAQAHDTKQLNIDKMLNQLTLDVSEVKRDVKTIKKDQAIAKKTSDGREPYFTAMRYLKRAALLVAGGLLTALGHYIFVKNYPQEKAPMFESKKSSDEGLPHHTNPHEIPPLIKGKLEKAEPEKTTQEMFDEATKAFLSKP